MCLTSCRTLFNGVVSDKSPPEKLLDKTEIQKIGQSILKNQKIANNAVFLKNCANLSQLNMLTFIESLEIDLAALEKAIKEKSSSWQNEEIEKWIKLLEDKPRLERLELETLKFLLKNIPESKTVMPRMGNSESEILSLLKKAKKLKDAPLFTNALDHAIHEFGYMPNLIEKTEIPYSPQNTSALFRFFSNIIDIFILSFGMTGPSTYDKNVTLEIYKKFFSIPVVFVALLQPLLIIAWKVYIVTIAVFGGITLGVYAYRKWFRPFPDTIPYCQNVEKFVADKHPRRIEGTGKEEDDLLTLFNIPTRNAEKKPIMVLGGTGEGKTTIFCKAYQDSISLNPPTVLKNKKFVVLKASALLSKSPYATLAEKINEILYTLEGFEKNTIVFIDEAHLLANRDGFESMKELMRTSGMQIIAATTWDEFDDKIKSADHDRSFRRSFNYVAFGKIDDTRLKILLQEILYNEADKVSFSKDALDEIIRLTNKSLKEVSQPGKAIKFLEMVIVESLRNYRTYEPEGLSKKKDRLTELLNLEKMNISRPDLRQRNEIDELRKEIPNLENDQRECKAKAAQIQALLKLKSDVKDQLLKDLYHLAQSKDKESVDVNLQKRYLLSYFYLLPALTTSVDEQIKALKGKMDLYMDARFITKTFQKFELMEKRAYAKPNGIAAN